ncbi:putative glycolipid-binding domain-containing protein [Antribacter sp. KLBMP9083]|uniref:Glycolipid-binding domain-containing protein n=1 Tax=Antribacter soli TaxID=2910976 RepID=A0AA41QI61_9MICO|nr:putative glycolipid-binding domain-containing protein [Antribacter soli]MCF4122607.1 putative glycolipid-binding domain-containing protein [Antribacter soli]
MSMALPPFAAWRLIGALDGFEVVYPEPGRLRGHATAVDLEASACTNTLPVHRLALRTGDAVVASAVYVQALDVAVRRLDQTYRRLDDHRFDYTSEGDFHAILTYDAAGFVIDYPGIAVRFA